MKKKFDPSHAEIEESHKQEMLAIMRLVDAAFNGTATGKDRKIGFVLLTFEYGNPLLGEDGRFNYMSNGADRRAMIKLFREQAQRMEEHLNGGQIV